MKYWVGIILLIIWSCKEKEVTYLQQEEVALAAPRLLVSNQIIDSLALVLASIGVPDAKIYYTNDGSNPDSTKTLYTNQIVVKEPGTYKFKAIHSAWQSSDIVETTFVKGGIKPSKIIGLTNPSEQYTGKAWMAMFNSKRGGKIFSNSEWVGFDSVAKAELIFNKPTYVKSVSLGYLNDPGSWIFPPEKIVLEFKNKQGVWVEQITELPKEEKIQAANLELFELEINKNTSELRITVFPSQIPQWHEGHGNKAWLFMDEWIVNQE